VKAIRRFTVRTVLPEPLRPLGELAQNLRWSWHQETRELFRNVDPEGWETAQGDPVLLLGSVSKERLAELAADRRSCAGWPRPPRTWPTTPPVHAGTRSRATCRRHRYFSPEFGVTSVLPQYSGGLGILAGDHLKAASDLSYR